MFPQAAAKKRSPSNLPASLWLIASTTIISIAIAISLRSVADEPSLNGANGDTSQASDLSELPSASSTKDAQDDSIDELSPSMVEMIGPGKQPPDSLEPLIEFARTAKQRFSNEIDAYTCLLVKQETLDGKLESPQYARLKIRERRVDGDRLIQPQSLYAKFLKPKDVAGREVLYVENERDGDLLVRRGGTRLPNLTLELKPDGPLARKQSNYSILQTGLRPMLEQILDRMESEIDPNNIEIRYFADAKVDGRPCQHIEVRQLEHRPDSKFQVAKVYIDIQLELPVYFSSFAWAEEQGGEPVLQEQYAITRIDLNAKLTDLDFNRTNPNYKFRPESEDQSDEESSEAP